MKNSWKKVEFDRRCSIAISWATGPTLAADSISHVIRTPANYFPGPTVNLRTVKHGGCTSVKNLAVPPRSWLHLAVSIAQLCDFLFTVHVRRRPFISRTISKDRPFASETLLERPKNSLSLRLRRVTAIICKNSLLSREASFLPLLLQQQSCEMLERTTDGKQFDFLFHSQPRKNVIVTTNCRTNAERWIVDILHASQVLNTR